LNLKIETGDTRVYDGNFSGNLPNETHASLPVLTVYSVGGDRYDCKKVKIYEVIAYFCIVSRTHLHVCVYVIILRMSLCT